MTGAQQGSSFFENEKRKEAKLERKIAEMMKQLDGIKRDVRRPPWRSSCATLRVFCIRVSLTL